MTSGEISPAKFLIFFFICHRAHTDLYRVHSGSCPTWYRTLRPHTVLACRSHRVLTVFLTVSSPCPHRVLTVSSPCPHRVLTVSSPCPHRVHTASSEICNAALKYVLSLWNMYCCTKNIYLHSEICYPDGMHTFANYYYAVQYGHRSTNGSITPAPRPLTVLIPGFHRVPLLVPTRRKVLSLLKTFAGSHRVSPAANGPPRCSPIAQRPRRVPSPCSTVRTKFTTRWHTVGLAGSVWQLHKRITLNDIRSSANLAHW